jgi:type IV pilus assembly protein PilV
MTTRSIRRATSRARGFSIVETLIALLLFSFAVIGAAGLQGSLLGHGQNSQFRAEASFFAEQIVGLAIADPANVRCYAFMSGCASTDAQLAAEGWRESVLAMLPGASTTPPTVSFSAASGEFTVTVFWRRPGDDTMRNFVVNTAVR